MYEWRCDKCLFLLVESLDLLLVLGLDGVSLQLLSSSDKIVLRSPLIGNEMHLSHRFVRLESLSSSNVLQGVQDHLSGFGSLAHFLKMAAQALAGSPVHELVLDGNDQGNWVVSARVGVDADVLDVLASLVLGLKLL